MGNNAFIREVEAVRGELQDATASLGAQLQSVLAGAGGIAEGLRSNLQWIGSSGPEAEREGSVRNRLERQHTEVGDVIETLVKVVAHQGQLNERIFEISHDVMAAAEVIASISRESKMLSINTLVEAAHLGSEGQSFGIIAEEMSRLSDSIVESNNHIAELSGDLNPILQVSRENIQTLERSADTLSKASTEHQDEIEAVVSTLQQTVEEALAASDRELSSIVSTSRRALSGLRFEDPIHDRLQRLLQDFEAR